MAYLSQPFLGLHKRRCLAERRALQNCSTEHLSFPITDRSRSALSSVRIRGASYDFANTRRHGGIPPSYSPLPSMFQTEPGLNQPKNESVWDQKLQQIGKKSHSRGKICGIQNPSVSQATSLCSVVENLSLEGKYTEVPPIKWDQTTSVHCSTAKNDKYDNSKKKDWWKLAKAISTFPGYIFRPRNNVPAKDDTKLKVKPFDTERKVVQNLVDLSSNRSEPYRWMGRSSPVNKKNPGDVGWWVKKHRRKKRRRRRKEPSWEPNSSSETSNKTYGTLNSNGTNEHSEEVVDSLTAGFKQHALQLRPKRLRQRRVPICFRQNLNDGEDEGEHYDYGFNPPPTENVETYYFQDNTKTDLCEKNQTSALEYTKAGVKKGKKNHKKLSKRDKRSNNKGNTQESGPLKLRVDMPNVTLPSDAGIDSNDRMTGAPGGDDKISTCMVRQRDCRPSWKLKKRRTRQ